MEQQRGVGNNSAHGTARCCKQFSAWNSEARHATGIVSCRTERNGGHVREIGIETVAYSSGTNRCDESIQKVERVRKTGTPMK